MIKRLLFTLSVLLFSTVTVAGAEVDDLELRQITDDVYAIVGPLTNRTPENLGNNATFGFVVTNEGVVLIDPGATYKGAAKIHAVIKSVTDQPVKIVINSGGQDHRWLGNDYFKKQGAKVIANQRAVADHKAREQDQFFGMGNLIGDAGIEGTDAAYADETFDQSLQFTLGGVEFQLTHAGHAHTPGDSFIWLPRQQVVFTGDIVYTERMLGVGGMSQSKTWLGAFEAIAALKPKVLVPGHGQPTTLAKATADTYDYLVFLRNTVGKFMEEGGGIEDIGTLNQTRFAYLNNFDQLKGRNAQRVYEEMEWE